MIYIGNKIKDLYKVISKNIKDAEETLLEHKQALSQLQESCRHKNMVDDYGTGKCQDCGYVTIGWHCPTSPDKECEYYNAEEDRYDEDCCVYCGHPEERK